MIPPKTLLRTGWRPFEASVTNSKRCTARNEKRGQINPLQTWKLGPTSRHIKLSWARIIFFFDSILEDILFRLGALGVLVTVSTFFLGVHRIISRAPQGFWPALPWFGCWGFSHDAKPNLHISKDLDTKRMAFLSHSCAAVLLTKRRTKVTDMLHL